MFKVIALLKRRAGISAAEMRDYYENHHLALALRTFPQIIEHRRNYLDHSSGKFGSHAQALNYDVITEIWFENLAGFEAMLAVMSDPELGALLREDERRFLDTEHCGMLVVEEAPDIGKGNDC